MKKYISALWRRKIARFEPCPLPGELTLLGEGKVMVVAPHSDDEVLGCGGTLALLRRAGVSARVVIVTDGAAGDPHGYAGGEVVRVRRQESRAALAAIGVDDVVFLEEPDGAFDESSRFRGEMTRLIHEYRPDWLFLPSIMDYHRDHVAIGLSAMGCWERSGRGGRAFFYEIWAPLPANAVVDITAVIEEKQSAASCYALPLKYRDYREAMLGLASYRGLYLPPSGRTQYAEAFLELGKGRVDGVVSALMRLRFLLERWLSHTKYE